MTNSLFNRLYNEGGRILDHITLEKLYIKYYSEVFSYAFSLCKNYHDAQELVSDTFFKALISLDLGKDHSNFKYWLLRVCKNNWLDGIKKKKYISDKEIDDNLTVSEKDVFKGIFQNEAKQELYEKIQELPRTYKEIIILYYFCNLSLKDISKIMDITPGASRMLISRARKQLQERLNKEDFL